MASRAIRAEFGIGRGTWQYGAAGGTACTTLGPIWQAPCFMNAGTRTEAIQAASATRTKSAEAIGHVAVSRTVWFHEEE